MGLLLLFVNAHAHRSKVFGHLHAGSTGNRREGQGIVLASACAQEMRRHV